MPIREFEVVDPPTSGEVESLIRFKFSSDEVVELILLAADQEVPRPHETPAHFAIRRISDPANKPMTTEGEIQETEGIPEHSSIIVRASPNATEPATASVVTA